MNWVELVSFAARLCFRTDSCLKNEWHIYLFKDLHSQSVGLWYSPLFLLFFFLCHLWQLVVNPTENPHKKGRYRKRKMLSEVWGRLSYANSWYTRDKMLSSETKAGKNLNSLINRFHRDSFFTLTTPANLLRDLQSQIRLLLKKKITMGRNHLFRCVFPDKVRKSKR